MNAILTRSFRFAQTTSMLRDLPAPAQAKIIRLIQAEHAKVHAAENPHVDLFLDRVAKMDRALETRVTRRANILYTDESTRPRTQQALDGWHNVDHVPFSSRGRSLDDVYPTFDDGMGVNVVAYDAIRTAWHVLGTASKVEEDGKFTPDMFWRLLFPVDGTELLDHETVDVRHV